MTFVFEIPLLYSILFGSIFGGSSSIVVISLASRIKVNEKVSTTLILESAITDILCIVISLSILEIIITGETNLVAMGITIADKFLLGAAIGIFVGITWLLILKKVTTLPFSYILTLGIILFAYAASEFLGGSGALSSLLFGLILGNEKELSAVFALKGKKKKSTQNSKTPLAVSKGFKRFEAEIAFLVRTFFFVFLGIIATISSLTFLLYGVLLSLVLLAIRYGAVWLSTVKCELRKDHGLMTVVLTRGLAAAVLATLPAQFGLLYADLFVNLAVVIVVSTAIIATLGVLVISREKSNGTSAEKEKAVTNDVGSKK
jgi:cell volume regulation protein A